MDVRSLTDSCISIMQECSFIALSLERIKRKYKGVPLCVKALADDLDEWMEPLLEVQQIVKRGGELLDTELAQLSDHWDDIKLLLDDGMELIDEFYREKHVRERAFIYLADSFKEEGAKLYTWIDLAQLKVREIETVASNTEVKKMFKRLLDEFGRLRNDPVQRPDYQQSPTNLGQLADVVSQTAPIQENGESSKKKGKAVSIREKGESSKKKKDKAVPTREEGESSKKKKGKAVDKQAAGVVSLPSMPLHPVYVDTSAQTEPRASFDPAYMPPPLSHFPSELDLTKPKGFPVCRNGRWERTGSGAT